MARVQHISARIKLDAGKRLLRAAGAGSHRTTPCKGVNPSQAVVLGGGCRQTLQGYMNRATAVR